jgi:hypothetical protein
MNTLVLEKPEDVLGVLKQFSQNRIRPSFPIAPIVNEVTTLFPPSASPMAVALTEVNENSWISRRVKTRFTGGILTTQSWLLLILDLYLALKHE